MTQVDTIHTKNRVRLTCYNSRTHFFNNSATSVIRLLVHHYGPQFGLEFKDDQITCHRQAACIATYICEPYVVSDHALRSMSYTTAAGYKFKIDATDIETRTSLTGAGPSTSELLRTL